MPKLEPVDHDPFSVITQAPVLQIDPAASGFHTSGPAIPKYTPKSDPNYTIKAYHGTQAAEPIKQFQTGNIHNYEGELIHQGSGDPNAYIGPHFADTPQVANKFAMGAGATGLRGDWLKSRYTEGAPSVYPVTLHGGNVKKFKNEDELNDFVYSHNVNTPEIESILERDHGDMEIGGEKYDSDPEYRMEVNREAVLNESGYDEPSTETASELGFAARGSLESQGVTTVQYPNAVEGGTSYIAIETPRSALTGKLMLEPVDHDPFAGEK